MNLQRAVFGIHAMVALLAFGVAAVAATSGQLVQFAIFSAIGLMVALLGRSAGRIAANR
jgi:hypothetical protein